MTKLPLAKTNDMLVQELNDEVLIYNLQNNQIFCLNKTAGTIWQNCDGKQTFEGLKKLGGGFNDEVISLSLAELQKNNLLENNSEKFISADGLSRRSMISKFGSAAIALPVVTMLVAPLAVSAQSSACADGFANCDGNPANGCETNLLTDANNCGRCFNPCPPFPNGTSTCGSGVCQFSCNSGFANCDGNPANGCETNLLSDNNNCGRCGNACPFGFTCRAGVCSFI